MSRDAEEAHQDTADPHPDGDAALQDTEHVVQDTGEVVQDTEHVVQDTGEVVQDTEHAVQDTPTPHQDTEAALRDTPTPIEDREAALPDATPSQEISQEIPVPRPSLPSPSRRPGPPLLASQALIEDLAPVEPLGRHARILCVVAGLLFALLGALPLVAPLHGQHALVPSLVVGAVTLFAAVARVTYRKRAVAMVALGAIVAGLGIAGTGPAQGTAEGGAIWSLARFVAASSLPAALLFRARYRAFEGARLLLGLAFLTAIPYGLHSIGLLIGPTAFGIAQVGAILTLVLLAAGLPGFMGSETTAAGSFTAPAMIVAFALQAGLQRLGALVPGSLADVFGVVETVNEDGDIIHRVPMVALSTAALRDAAVTAVAFAASAWLSALGLFQILAWKFAPAARKIDVRRSLEEVRERPSVEEWSTRS